MRTVFFGTPRWAVPSLQALLDSDIEVVAVVTNPDRPAGRRMELNAPPVKVFALHHGLELLQPASARSPELAARLAELAPDVAAVVAYGKLLPPELLALPAYGFVNLHFSLLPAYRGAAPVQRAVMAGEALTGVSTFVLTEGMDEGPLLLSKELPVDEDESAGELGDRLADAGAPVLVDSLRGYVSGTLTPREQDHASATYAPKVTTADARIDWSRPTIEVHNIVRGTNPDPGAWTTFRGTRVRLFALSEVPDPGPLAPGEMRVESDLLVVGAGDGNLGVKQAQRAGGRAMSGAELARGLRPAPGERFE